jgi:hypothetical protein
MSYFLPHLRFRFPLRCRCRRLPLQSTKRPEWSPSEISVLVAQAEMQAPGTPKAGPEREDEEPVRIAAQAQPNQTGQGDHGAREAKRDAAERLGADEGEGPRSRSPRGSSRALFWAEVDGYRLLPVALTGERLDIHQARRADAGRPKQAVE